MLPVAYPATAATWADLRAVYNVDGVRRVMPYAGPVTLALVGIGQAVASGTALDFATSLLSATSPVLGCK